MDRSEGTATPPKRSPQPAHLFPFQMTAVRLRKIEAEVCEPVETAEPGLSARLEVPEGPPPQLDEFDLMLHFEVRLINTEDESFNLSVVLEGHFEAVVDPTTIDQQVARRFFTSDAALVLWPYLREIVQSITARMGFIMPPLPIIDARSLLEAATLSEQT